MGWAMAFPKPNSRGLAHGRDVIFNGSRAALPQALARFPSLTVLVIGAPEPVLAARIAARGREAGRGPPRPAGAASARPARRPATIGAS